MNLDKLRERRSIIFWSAIFIIWIAWFINSPLSNPLRKFLGLNYAAVYSSTPDSNLLSANGTVMSILPDNSGGYYIGGSFTYIGNYVGSSIIISSSTGAAISGYPVTVSSVRAIIPDYSGGWYIGGISSVNGNNVNSVSRILSDGSVDSDFNLESSLGTVDGLFFSTSTNQLYLGLNQIGLRRVNATTGEVDSNFFVPVTPNAITSMIQSIDGSKLYLIGSFSLLGVPAMRSVIVSTTTGDAISTEPSTNGSVSVAIPDHSGGYYIGGGFTLVASTTHNRLAHILSDGTVDQNFNPIVDNNTVTNMVLSQDGTKLYFGGTFTSVNGVTKNRLAAVNTSDGSLVTSFDPNISNGEVRTTALSLDESVLYIGGSFTTVSTTTRNRIAAINTSDGSLVSSFDPNANSNVQTLSISSDGGILYIGGSFTTIGTTTRNYAVAINTSDGSLTSFNPNMNSTVFSSKLSQDGTKIYLGGSFGTIGGTTRPCIALANVSDGSIVSGFNANATAGQCTFFSLALSTSTLYMGGNVAGIGGVTRSGSVAVDSTTGAVLTDFYGNTDGSASALALSSNQGSLYMGGLFSTLGATRPGFAAINTSDGSVVKSFNPTMNTTGASTGALSPDGNTLYIGGFFTTINGVSRNRLAAINLADNTVVSSFNPNVSGTISSIALSQDGTKIYLGGSFTTVGGITRNRLAAVNTSDGSLVTSFDPNVTGGTVQSVKFSGDENRIYFLGQFTTVGTTTQSGFAAVNTSDGSLVPGFNPDVAGLNLIRSSVGGAQNGDMIYLTGTHILTGGAIRNRLAHILADGTLDNDFNLNVNNTIYNLAKSPDGNTLYIGGDFTSIGTTTRNRIAAINTSDGNLINSFDPNSNNSVLTLTLSSDNNTLYLGGIFTTIGTTTRNRIAAVNTSDGSLVLGFDPNANNTMNSITLSQDGNTLYLGGIFTTIGTTTRNRLAAVNTSDGSLVTTFNPNANGSISKSLLSTDGLKLYVGGSFSTIGGVSRNNLAAVNTSDGSLVTTFNPNVNSNVNNLILSDSLLYFVGSFNQVGGVTRNRLAAVNISDGSLHTTFNPGLGSIGNSISILSSGDKMIIGGSFTTVGSLNSPSLATLSLVPDTTTVRTSYRYVTPIIDELSQTDVGGGVATTSTSTSSITLISAGTTTTQVTETKPIITTETFTFEINLRQGMISEDVRELQKFLNKYGFQVAQTGAGSPGKETTYFGNLTRLALIKFQEVYVKDILSPLNLEKGTGFFGPYSRGVMNKILLGE